MTKKIEAKARVVLTDWRDEPASHKQLNYLNRLLLAGETGRKRISPPHKGGGLRPHQQDN